MIIKAQALEQHLVAHAKNQTDIRDCILIYDSEQGLVIESGGITYCRTIIPGPLGFTPTQKILRVDSYPTQFIYAKVLKDASITKDDVIDVQLGHLGLSVSSPKFEITLPNSSHDPTMPFSKLIEPQVPFEPCPSNYVEGFNFIRRAAIAKRLTKPTSKTRAPKKTERFGTMMINGLNLAGTNGNCLHYNKRPKADDQYNCISIAVTNSLSRFFKLGPIDSFCHSQQELVFKGKNILTGAGTESATLPIHKVIPDDAPHAVIRMATTNLRKALRGTTKEITLVFTENMFYVQSTFEGRNKLSRITTEAIEGVTYARVCVNPGYLRQALSGETTTIEFRGTETPIVVHSNLGTAVIASKKEEIT